jgi:putative flippase GtrA
MSSEVIRFVIFGSIGLFNAILDIFIWKFLVKTFNSSKPITSFVQQIKLNNYSFAHTISFIITVISSYFLNKNLTWKDTISNDSLQSIKFFGVATFSMFLTTIFLNFLTGKKIEEFVLKTFPFDFVKQHYHIIAKLTTILLSMVTNYTGYKLFVFVK